MIRYIVILPLLFLSGCLGSSHEIAKIPEASGICYSTITQTLFVANDEGKIYEMGKDGKILRKKRIGNYDLEGVSCDDDRGELLFAVEGDDAILVVSQKELHVKNKIRIKREFQGHLILKKDKKHGLEGITQDQHSLYLSNQSNKKYPKKDPSVVIKVAKSHKKKVVIEEIIDPGHQDIAGLFYHDSMLYMVSDKEDLLIGYDLQAKKVAWTKKLPAFAQEGICLDDEGNIYFANDDGSVLKYKKAELGF